MNLKSLLILFLALVVLFIPTYIAIGSYYRNKPEPGSVADSLMLTIKDPQQRVNTFDTEGSEDEKNTCALFDKMIKSAVPVGSLPDSISGGEFLLATYFTKNEEGETKEQTSYSFYFSTDTAKCYFKDTTGKAYKLAKEDAASFLETPYAVYLYSGAVPPVLTVSGDTVIPPSELKWFYLGQGNKFLPYTESESDIKELSYDVGNTISFNFSNEPSVCTLKVFNGDVLLYDGSYNNLGALDLKKNAVLSFRLSAEWPEAEGVAYYGTSTYTFNAKVTAPAEFKLGQDEIFQGEFAVIAGTNITDISSISFKSVPEIGYTPVFYPDGDNVYALIPISYGLTKGNYVFSVSYGLVSKEFTLKVKDWEYGYKDGSLDVSKSLIESCYSNEDQAEYSALVKKICTEADYSVSSGKLFDGAFLDYQKKGVLTTNGAPIRLGFGRNVKFTNAAGLSFEHTGVDFEAASNIAVPAMASGKVVYVGTCDVLGAFVVIDHGLGLKSWYAHLAAPVVKVGDTIEKGNAVGKTGNSGLTQNNRVHVGLTVGEIPVAPYGLWADRPVFPSFS
ncbi:MAG: M23 family metallopeptidase [Clostridia bacterium]|nr:M23 family metallopeptidase [Clostridia bacterium]